MLESPCYITVNNYERVGSPEFENGYRVELIIESTILRMGYKISKEKAKELATRIASRLGIEARLNSIS